MLIRFLKTISKEMTPIDNIHINEINSENLLKYFEEYSQHTNNMISKYFNDVSMII